MPTFRPLFRQIPTLLACLAFSVGFGQTLPSGKLFLLSPRPAYEGLYVIQYPALRLDTVEASPITDFSLNEQFLYTARGRSYLDSAGIDQFSLPALEKTDSLRHLPVDQLATWQDYLLLTTGKPPYVSVVDPQHGWSTVFSLDSTKVTSPPADLQTAGDTAFLLLGASVMLVSLSQQDTLGTIATLPPYLNQHMNRYLVQSPGAFWIGVQYATGAIRSSLLRMDKSSLQVSTAYHLEGGDSWYPPVPFQDRVYVYNALSYYEIGTDSLHYTGTLSSIVVAADELSETRFVWEGQMDSIRTEMENGLSSMVHFPGEVRVAAFHPESVAQGIAFKPREVFQVFPNPTARSIQLVGKGPWSRWQYQWWDLQGRLLEKGLVSSPLTLPEGRGMLLLQLIGPEGEQVTYRILRE